MIIKDKLLDPFFILVEEDQYVLKEIKTPDPNNPLTKDVNKEYEVNVGYFTSPTALIHSVIQKQMARNISTTDLNGFWNALKKFELGLKEVLK